MTEGESWTGSACAKVNLHLEVLAREESGYHRLDTVFQALELADDVALEWVDGTDVSIEVTGVAEDALGPPESNLAVRAAKRFREAAAELGGTVPGVRIVLHKRIPHGAGLGGGSSDAATVLRGLNALSGEPFRVEALAQLGAELGADVPFFVAGASRARGVGRGDLITPVASLPRRPVLLLLPSEPIPTGWAYAALVEARAKEGRSAAIGAGWGSHEPHPSGRERTEALDDWPAAVRESRNDFERILFPLRPELRVIRDALASAGAELAMLSGSGSAVFGIFSSDEAVTRAERVLDAEPSPAWTHTIRTATAE